MSGNQSVMLFTMSYDDGVIYDETMIEILNKYGIKATFNINSGFLDSDNHWNYNGLEVSYLTTEKAKNIYKGHEIAVHTVSHPFLEKLTDRQVEEEIFEDKLSLGKLFATPVYGMAYPYGTYNQDTIRIAKACGIQYSRTVETTHSFLAPASWMEWHFTCHHNDEHLMDLAAEFCSNSSNGIRIFSVWGHSYEFEGDNNWQVLEKLCQYLSQFNQIHFVTNKQAMDMILASAK